MTAQDFDPNSIADRGLGLAFYQLFARLDRQDADLAEIKDSPALALREHDVRRVKNETDAAAEALSTRVEVNGTVIANRMLLPQKIGLTSLGAIVAWALLHFPFHASR